MRCGHPNCKGIHGHVGRMVERCPASNDRKRARQRDYDRRRYAEGESWWQRHPRAKEEYDFRDRGVLSTYYWLRQVRAWAAADVRDLHREDSYWREAINRAERKHREWLERKRYERKVTEQFDKVAGIEFTKDFGE